MTRVTCGQQRTTNIGGQLRVKFATRLAPNRKRALKDALFPPAKTTKTYRQIQPISNHSGRRGSYRHPKDPRRGGFAAQNRGAITNRSDKQ